MKETWTYDCRVCDLCASPEFSILVEPQTGCAMTSDRRIMPADLSKIICRQCGLVRSGRDLDLSSYYVEQYTLSTEYGDHIFYTDQGAVSRSRMLCEWLSSSMDALGWPKLRRCLEIGCGAGDLLAEFTRRVPEAVFEGIEPNLGAAQLARQKGLCVHEGTPSDFQLKEAYDLIYAVAVIEHVPSPSKFLLELRRLLKPHGHLVLCQPTQDVASYDVFFLDHLHHFGTSHLRAYASKCGFEEISVQIGHRWMPNFSLHLWKVANPSNDFKWRGTPVDTECKRAASTILKDMERVNLVLADLNRRDRLVGVFGLGEAFCLVRAYTSLGRAAIACGLDDAPNRPEYRNIGFPVVVPEECPSLGVRDVLLTMNKVYYPQASRRMERLGIVAYPVFS